MARKEKKQQEGAPLWVVTYGDMMSLLLCFFVILVAMSEIKKESKFREVMESIREAFGYVGGLGTVPSEAAPEMSLLKRLEQITIPRKVKNLADNDEEGIEGKLFRVEKVREGIKIRVGGAVAFGRFSPELKEEAFEPLAKLADNLKGKNNKIEIRGHATLEPLPAGSPYGDPWDLSYERAKAVGRKLIELGLRERRFKYVACGATEPVKSQAYDQDRLGQNRRVEIIVTESLVSDYEGSLMSFEEASPNGRRH